MCLNAEKFPQDLDNLDNAVTVIYHFFLHNWTEFPTESRWGMAYVGA